MWEQLTSKVQHKPHKKMSCVGLKDIYCGPFTTKDK